MMYRYGPMMYQNGYGWLNVLAHLAGGLLWLLLLTALIFFLVRLFSGNHRIGKYWGSRGEFHKTPLEILQRRYAKGKITKEEYLDMKQVLEKDLRPPVTAEKEEITKKEDKKG